MALNNSSLPYVFTQSLGSAMQKPISDGIAVYRVGVVYRDSAQFRFRFGDLQTAGTAIEFPEIPDSVKMNSVEMTNKYLVSKPFNLNDNSIFSYSVLCATADTANAKSVLGQNDNIKFTVCLEDAATGEMLGLYDEISFTKANVQQFKNTGYEVSAQGIGSRTVVLRLIVSSNSPMCYAVTQKVAVQNNLNKMNRKQINFTGKTSIKEYSISQNYPNPFNPTTTISYQLPKTGRVTLRIFDLLGKEIMRLVDEVKQAGAYQAAFNASALASGVYLYQIECNDYRAVKKMTVLK